MGMQVLVTGGVGRVGSYVVTELAHAGYHVTVFDQISPSSPINGVIYRRGSHEDIGQVLEVCAGVDAIIHLSAIPGPRTFPNTIVFRTNVMGTFNVHEAATMMRVPLVISTSSQSAYGFAWQHRPFFPLYLPLDEHHPDLAQDAYGLSKMAGEQLAHGFHRRSDLRICIIRPPLVIVPDEYTFWVNFILAAPEKWAEHLFTYVDVRDLAVAYRLVLEAPPEVIQNEVFNVAADDAIASAPLAEVLPSIDPAFTELAARLTGTQPMVDTQRIKQQLGWRPKFSWRDGQQSS